MIIYIDTDYKCYVNPGDGLTAVETDAFDGKCDTYIEGYRFVPSGSTWTRSDGVEFAGEMVVPCTDYNEISKTQTLYENVLSSSEPRIAALEAENAALKEDNTMLTAQVSALSDQLDFYEDCIAEMAEVVYA